MMNILAFKKEGTSNVLSNKEEIPYNTSCIGCAAFLDPDDIAEDWKELFLKRGYPESTKRLSRLLEEAFIYNYNGNYPKRNKPSKKQLETPFQWEEGKTYWIEAYWGRWTGLLNLKSRQFERTQAGYYLAFIYEENPE